jgi:hypothetical protein
MLKSTPQGTAKPEGEHVLNDRNGRMWIAMALTLASTVGAQRPGAAPVSTVSPTTRSAAYYALIDGMRCRQHASGRMDCEFRAGTGLRFTVNGVGQEDVVITVVQSDSAGDYTASVVPLHGCVVVKPIPSADKPPAADSVSTFAYVSPRTGKVYPTWATCLTATRPDARVETKVETKADTVPVKPRGAAARPPRH